MRLKTEYNRTENPAETDRVMTVGTFLTHVVMTMGTLKHLLRCVGYLKKQIVHFAFAGPRPYRSRKASSRSRTQGRALAEPAEPGVSCGPNSFSLVTVSGANRSSKYFGARGSEHWLQVVPRLCESRLVLAQLDACCGDPVNNCSFRAHARESSDFNKSCSSERMTVRAHEVFAASQHHLQENDYRNA